MQAEENPSLVSMVHHVQMAYKNKHDVVIIANTLMDLLVVRNVVVATLGKPKNNNYLRLIYKRNTVLLMARSHYQEMREQFERELNLCNYLEIEVNNSLVEESAKIGKQQ